MKNKNIIITYLVVTLIFLSGIILSFNKYSYCGYYSDKIINWVWLAMTIFIIVWFWRKKVIKVYFGLLISGTILSILPMMIPFFGILLYFSTIGCDQRIQLNETYRIERGRPGALYNPQITIYQKQSIFERKISRIPYSDIIDKILQPSPATYIDEKRLPIQEAKLINANKDSIGIEYQIMNKKKTIYHKNKDNWFEN